MSQPDDVAIGRAIARALADVDRSQAWLGAEVAKREGRPDPYAQALVSDWIRGRSRVGTERLAVVEEALALKPGELTRLSGFLPVDGRAATSGVEAALAADPRISEDQREMLQAAYRAALRGHRARQSQRSD